MSCIPHVITKQPEISLEQRESLTRHKYHRWILELQIFWGNSIYIFTYVYIVYTYMYIHIHTYMYFLYSTCKYTYIYVLATRGIRATANRLIKSFNTFTQFWPNTPISTWNLQIVRQRSKFVVQGSSQNRWARALVDAHCFKSQRTYLSTCYHTHQLLPQERARATLPTMR